MIYVIAHEMGHAILDILTGGTILNFYFDFINLGGKTTFTGGNMIITGAGGIIAGGLLSIIMIHSGNWVIQFTAAMVAFRNMCECALIMPGADITFLKGTFIAPLIVVIAFTCGYIAYAGLLKGLGKNVNITYGAAVGAVTAIATAAYLLA